MQLGDGDEAVYSELPLVGRVSRLLLKSGYVFSLGLGLFFFFVTGYATTHTLSFPRVVSNATSHAISQCYPNLIPPYIYLQSVAVALNIPDLQASPITRDFKFVEKNIAFKPETKERPVIQYKPKDTTCFCYIYKDTYKERVKRLDSITKAFAKSSVW